MFEVEALSVSRTVANRQQRMVDDLRFKVGLGRTIAIVGDNASVLSSIGLALQGLTAHKDDRLAGTIKIGATTLKIADAEQMELRRGGDFGFAGAVAPKKTVSDLLIDTYLIEHQVDKRIARQKVLKILEVVGLDNVELVLTKQISSLRIIEQRQVMLANAICNEPRLLIVEDLLSDIEPTDVLHLVELVASLRDRLGCAVVWLAQSLSESVMYADEIVLMHGARAVESGSRSDVLLRPEMPYTVALLSRIPSFAHTGLPAASSPVPAGEVPAPSGCSFVDSCGRATLVERGQCVAAVPVMAASSIGHEVRCHLAPGLRVRFARQILGGES